MNELSKIVLCAILFVALSPFLAFWVAALVCVALFLLPAGVIFSKLFPNAWRYVVEHSPFSRTSCAAS